MPSAEPRWQRFTTAMAGRLDGAQIADLLWMAQLLAAEIPTEQAVVSVATDQGQAPSGNTFADRSPPLGDIAATADSLPDPPVPPPPPPPAPGALVEPATGAEQLPHGIPTVTVAEAGLLARPRRYGRALAPLSRWIDHGPAHQLNVPATVAAIARARVERSSWQPVLCPRREPWIQLHLVFDGHSSMALWQRLRRELPRTLAQQVRWRDLRCWHLGTSDAGAPELRGPHGRRCAPGALQRLGDRNLVLVVSDGIAPGWCDGGYARLLRRWAARQPVVMLQVLPPRLWPRTGLGQQEAGWVQARRALQPNASLHWQPFEQDPFGLLQEPGPPPAGTLTLPLTSLDPEDFAGMARLLGGPAGGYLRAVRFEPPPATPATAPPAPQPPPEPDSQAIEQQLALFLFTASPQARRLLGLLTFAPVITLPVVRLIQRQQLAGSGPAQVAEVLFSGLFRNVAAAPAEGAPRVPADRQRLEFVDEGLRGRLREGLRVGEARAVFDAVKAEVARHLNRGVESFEALLRQPEAQVSDEEGELLKAFATVAPSCLRGLGRRYEELADAIERAWAFGREVQAGPVNAVAVLGDGRMASGGGDGAIRLWDPASGACTAVFEGHDGPVYALAELGDGRLASGSTDRTIRVWDLSRGACTAVIEGHDGPVHALAVLGDGRLASGSTDRTIRIWDLSSGACTAVLEGHGGPVSALVVLADGRLASGGGDGTIRLWDRSSGACTAVLEGHDGPVYALAVLGDGRLASGSTDRTIRLWDPLSAACSRILAGHTGSVAALVGLADGRLASGSFDQSIRLWDPNGGACLVSHEQLGTPVRALAALADGRLAFGGADHTIHLWEPPSERLLDLEPLSLEYETARLEEIALQPITFTTSVLDEQLRRSDSQGQGWAFFHPQGPAGLTLVQIPAGTFVMGSPLEGEGWRSAEGPQHEVWLSSFLMGQTPITQAQWREVAQWQPRPGEQWGRDLNPDPSHFNGEDRPVEKVSWFDAMEFCKRLSQRTGHHYTLPSEAQWEYACRAGTTTPFHFGTTITSELANYNGNFSFANGPTGAYREETLPVGGFPANGWGLQDMHGNVLEWCLDDWHGSYEGAPPVDGSAWLDPAKTGNKKDSKSRLLRGGSWFDSPRCCRSAYRTLNVPGNAFYDVGVRVVCLPQGPSLSA